jgi:hypothetical protein
MNSLEPYVNWILALFIASGNWIIQEAFEEIGKAKDTKDVT